MSKLQSLNLPALLQPGRGNRRLLTGQEYDNLIDPFPEPMRSPDTKSDTKRVLLTGTLWSGITAP